MSDDKDRDLNTVGAVLVVGGGIAGMQAALDLADGGFKVYLSETTPGIGGKMARLDKTFPTNDCSMCIMSPKLVEAGRHLDINILPGTTVVGLEGEPGKFSTALQYTARGVDIEKCTACGDCERVCPVDLPDQFDAKLRTRKAIYRLYPQAVPNAYAIDKRKISPCRAGCPAGVNTHAYAALIRAGKYKEAWSVIYRQLPLPGVLGRVCPHPCESKCHRAEIDEPIALCALKRFVSDQVWALEPEAVPSGMAELKTDARVGVIGAGPAGLACAYRLRSLGVPVTVFEARSYAGGMLAAGIPEYRLPRDVLNREVDIIARSGVDIEYGTMLGRDLTLNSLQSEFKAVFVGAGAGSSTELGVPGEDLEGVDSGIDFLERVNVQGERQVGERVLVIGGGNTAMDAARTAVRLGAKQVTVAYRRTVTEITALPEEMQEAEEEGVVFTFLVSPVEFEAGADGKVCRAKLIRNELGEPDASGRRRPVAVPGSEYYIDVDTVLLAVGQKPMLELDVDQRANGTIIVDDNMQTSIPGVYAGGDVATGPATVIEAVAAGNKAAEAIARQLGVIDEVSGVWPPAETELADVPLTEAELAGAPWAAASVTPRIRADHEHAEERRGDFREVVSGFSEEQARVEAGRCMDCGGCCECLECVTACGPGAIDHKEHDARSELDVGSVILAPGYDLFDPSVLGEYGYGIYPNVITSMEFERLLSASGPTGGHIIRPGDEQEPGRVAFIQCVGSRDERTCGYCSAVCCMHATKEAIIAGEHAPGLETTILYNDMRAFGKEFDRYYERARDEYGVRYVKCMVSSIKELPGGDLKIKFFDPAGEIQEEQFDLVVLSVGLRPPKDAQAIADATGVELNGDGFCKCGEYDRVCTSRPGVFAAGCFSEPKDIPETVVEASAAAGAAARLLGSARGSLVRTKEYPPEKDVAGQPPRIGVFVCHCGLNIASVIDVSAVAEYARTLSGVVFTDHLLYTCAQDSIARIKDAIEEYELNRVVVASCTPRTHEPLFRETIREAGLNPYLFELANIREQASWVHQKHQQAATDKAKNLVAMAIAKSRLLMPLATPEFSVVRRGLVIGGGVSGLSAALTIADQGYEVMLVERSAQLGGLFSGVGSEPGGEDPAQILEDMIGKVTTHSRIQVSLNSELASVQGCVGNFRSTIRSGDELVEFEHGAVVIATGGQEADPEGRYGYGQHPHIVTLREWEKSPVAADTIAFIQCVGSRDEHYPYCSRVCCTSAIKEAIKLKLDDQERNVIIFYRDIRTYGFREYLYQQARELGVVFVRFDQEQPPEVSVGSEIIIRVYDTTLGDTVTVAVDNLVLACGIRPADNANVSQLLKVPLTSDGFFAEAHAKLRPNEFAVDGVFLCGVAHAPRFAAEAIAQGTAAGNKAANLLSQKSLVGQAIVATVNERLCKACGICLDACPYDAREIDEQHQVVRIQEILCQGCGACVVACPNGAAGQRGFERRQILAMVDAALD